MWIMCSGQGLQDLDHCCCCPGLHSAQAMGMGKWGEQEAGTERPDCAKEGHVYGHMQYIWLGMDTDPFYAAHLSAG